MASPSLNLLQGDPTTWGNPPSGKTFVGINELGQLVLKQSDGTVTPVTSSAPSFDEIDSTSGDVTVTPTQPNHTQIVDYDGRAAGAAVIIISEVGPPEDGAQIALTVKLPATAGVAIDIRNGTGGGAQIDTYTSNGDTLSAYWRLTYSSADSVWIKTFAAAPAY